MAGWIKISREITDHWLWQDAERLKWWLDLLIMANWKDNKALIGGKLIEVKRGQMFASVRYLQDRWAKRDKKGKVITKPSVHKIINFVTLLEQEKMISRDFREHQNTIITICNYDKYHIDSNTCGNACGNACGNTCGNTCGNKTKKVKEINNKEVVVEDNARAREEKQGYTRELGRGGEEDNARAREEKLYEEQLRNDRQIAEITCNNLRITMQQYTGMLEEFFGEQSAKGCVHRNYADFCNHAYNWLRVHRRLNKIDDNGRTDYEQTSHDYRRDAERDAEDAARRDRENALEAMREIARTNGIEFNA